jgi:hypothetical protein
MSNKDFLKCNLVFPPAPFSNARGRPFVRLCGSPSPWTISRRRSGDGRVHGMVNVRFWQSRAASLSRISISSSPIVTRSIASAEALAFRIAGSHRSRAEITTINAAPQHEASLNRNLAITSSKNYKSQAGDAFGRATSQAASRSGATLPTRSTVCLDCLGQAGP